MHAVALNMEADSYRENIKGMPASALDAKEPFITICVIRVVAA